jgi:short subunit dehydrogenase-like uncharacterized protein
VVLLGATGFTGSLVAEELARRPGRIRWAVAGRDPARLRDLKMGLVGISPDNGEVGTVVADTSDPASLAALARQTRILVTTVGPYAERGIGVVEACVEAGTHYLDITGEPAFVDESRARFDAAAAAKGLRIVHCCGFDSVPADLGTLFAVSALPAGVPKQVRCYVRTNASFSGGTWASFVGALASGDARGRRGDGGGARGPVVHRPPFPVRGVAIPLPVIDRAVVRRSARAMPERYGPDFAYGQFLVLRDLAKVGRLAAGFGAVWALAQTRPTRRLLLSLRRGGEGPSADARAQSFFALTLVAKAGGAEVVARVSGGDPGYDETSRMLAHAALLLAERERELPAAAGVLTPAVAFGDLGIEAMRDAGLKFEILAPGVS